MSEAPLRQDQGQEQSQSFTFSLLGEFWALWFDPKDDHSMISLRHLIFMRWLCLLLQLGGFMLAVWSLYELPTVMLSSVQSYGSLSGFGWYAFTQLCLFLGSAALALMFAFIGVKGSTLCVLEMRRREKEIR